MKVTLKEIAELLGMKNNAAQLAEPKQWERAILDCDKAELKGIAEEIYRDFAFADGEEYYRENGFHHTDDSEWQERILEESEARIRRKIITQGARQRAVNDMREAMEDALKNYEDWTTLSWVVAKIKADDERNAKAAKAFDKMMCA